MTQKVLILLETNIPFMDLQNRNMAKSTCSGVVYVHVSVHVPHYILKR